ncbi:MAG: AMP-binding protein, partial [Myxococcota bacterium]
MNTHETVVDLLQRRASGPGGTTFLLDGRAGQEHLSFAELDRRARAIGAELVARGATGERVLLLYPPGLAYVAAFFGCLYAGAVAVPVYPPRPDRPLSRFLAILSDARPAFALTTEPIRQLGEALLGPHAALDWLATDTMSLDPADSWRRPDVDRRSLAFLQYTSGSTADPKGVRVTHGNLLHNEAQIQRAFDTDASSRIVGWLPLYHDMGLIGNVLHPLYLGADCVLMSPLEFLRDPLWWLEAVSEHRGVVSGGPNFAFDLCVRKATPEVLARLDLSSWRVAFNGAEPVRPDTMARFAETFGPCGFRGDAFLPCYGLAEGTLLVSAGRDPRPTWFRADALERKVAIPVAPGSDSGRALSQSGVFLPGSVRIVDPASRAEVEPGAVGEIWVRSDSVADGYWGRAELTESTFRATTAAGDGPFLRTGDLGFLQGDRLFVAGREKDLLIVRGRNHYPQDLERTAELAHPSLRPGCAAAFAIDRDGEERAVVVVEVGAPPQDPAAVVDAVRAAVARDHEVVLDAVVLIAARTLPKTSSGKVQRRACRAAWLAGELAVVHGSSPAPAPRPAAGSDLARFLAQRVSALAGVPASPEAPLSRFALDSLQLAELARSVDDRFGVRVPVDLLFTDRSIGAVAELLDALPRSAGGVDGRSDGLSVGQRALWFLDRLDPDGAGAYLVANAVELRGPLDEAALAAAFDQLVERHPQLRTVWPAVDGEPRPAPAPRRPRLVCDPAASLDDEARRPFRLDQDAPIRAVLARRGPPVLLVVTHHLVTDLWSQALLLEELGALYEAARDRRPASLPPADDFGRYVAWQEALLAGPDGERLERSWLDALGAEVPPLALPTRPRPPVASTAGDQVSFALDPHTSERVLGLARARAVTPFVLLLAAYETLLYRYTGQRELVVGTVASGRSRPEHARMIGYFVNALPLRASLSPDQPFGALLGATRAAVARAFRDQDLPFARLVELARPERDLSRAPLFQTMFALQQGAVGGRSVSGFAVNAPGARLDWAGLELRPVPLDRRIAQFDLGLTMAEVDGRLYGTFDFPVALFDRGFVAAMAERFVTLLQGIVAQPDAPLRALPVVSDRERDAQVAGWSATERPLDDRPVHVRFAAAALASPDAVAVACAGARVSYAELDARSARWARALVARGVGPEQIVGLCLERTPALPAAVLAVLRAGGAWLPLDPAQPAARRDQLAADAGAALVLSDADLAGLDVEIVPSDPPAIVQSDPSATAQSDPSAIVQSDPPLPRIGGEGRG